MKILTQPSPKTSKWTTLPSPTPDLTTFCLPDEPGPERATLLCRPVELDDLCHRCDCRGSPRDSVIHKLAHVPFGQRPAILQARLRWAWKPWWSSFCDELASRGLSGRVEHRQRCGTDRRSPAAHRAHPISTDTGANHSFHMIRLTGDALDA